MWDGVLIMAKPLSALSRHTGWQFVYGLLYEFSVTGYCLKSDIGCIDAPTSLAGGSVCVDEYRTLRWVAECGIARGD